MTRLSPTALPLLTLIAALAACGGTPAATDTPADATPAGADMPADAADGAAGDAPGDGAAPAGGDEGTGPAAPAAGAAPPAEAPAGEPAPKASAMDLGGTLSTAQVAKFVEDHQSYFDPCIQIAEKAGKVYKVSITTKVWVGPRGKVNKTEIVKTTSKDKSFGECVTGAFEKIAFGKPRDGATATLTFPMTFSGEVE